MITIPPLPSIKCLLKKNGNKQNYTDFWKSPGYSVLEMARTQYSLVLIIRWYMKMTDKDSICVWVPDYFCNDTLQPLKGMKDVTIIYYPIDLNFEPCWKVCDELAQVYPPALYIAVHFFGKSCDINRSLSWCRKFQAFLIEDCAHVLLPDEKMGTTGDFILFSMHKLLAVPSGALLLYNSEQLIAHFKDEFAEGQLLELYQQLRMAKDEWTWLLKRMIQKVLPISPKVKKLGTLSVGNDETEQCTPLKTSNLSKLLLSKYQLSDLKGFTVIRKRNLEIMNDIIKNEYHLKPVLEQLVPYLGLYQYNPNNREKVEQLLAHNLLVQKWPTLPREILDCNQQTHEVALELSAKTFTLPIHQSIKRQELLRRYAAKQEFILDKSIKLRDCNSPEEWKDLFDRLPKSTLTQDWYYGEAKRLQENDRIARKIVYCNNHAIGLVQILIKHKYSIKIIRVNRGPLLLEEYKTAVIVFTILQLIKKNFHHSGPHVFFFNPELEDSYESIKLFTDGKYREWRSSCYQSGWLNLSNGMETLHASLKSKWRNQLRNSIKRGITIQKYTGDIEKLIELYEENMRQKHFKGISSDLLRQVYLLNPGSLLILGAYQQENLVAYDIAYIHGNSMTYLIGWIGKAGRTNYANNYLLYSLAEYGSLQNIKYFDMGGMDTISTPEIARFKNGMNPEKYKLLGEFYCF